MWSLLKCSGPWVIVLTEKNKFSDDAENNAASALIANPHARSRNRSGRIRTVNWTILARFQRASPWDGRPSIRSSLLYQQLEHVIYDDMSTSPAPSSLVWPSASRTPWTNEAVICSTNGPPAQKKLYLRSTDLLNAIPSNWSCSVRLSPSLVSFLSPSLVSFHYNDASASITVMLSITLIEQAVCFFRL